MSIKLTFGKHEGKTLEWLFFKAPWYAEFIYNNGIHRQENQFSEEEGDYFLELFNRASELTGTCRWCRQRPVTRMGLSTLVSGALGHIGFYCEECEYTGGSSTGYYRPSFFVEEHTLPRCEQLRITEFIKNRYMGSGTRLTQENMEDFFHNDANFVYAKPGFFNKQLALSV